jgi:hypothetical protein
LDGTDGATWLFLSTVAAGKRWGCQLSKAGNAKTAEAALEDALTYRLRHLGRLSRPSSLRSHNGLLIISQRYIVTVRAYHLTQEFNSKRPVKTSVVVR